MPQSEKSLAVVAEWVLKAENDLTNAVHTLKLGRKCPTDTVCFHAQQCVEKYLKAYLVLADVNFPKTHDIESLVSPLPITVRLPLTVEQQEILSDYAVFSRYPGDSEPIPLAEARTAVRLAKRVRKFVRSMLPPKALEAHQKQTGHRR
jgi:HEPN domain-containing protein